MYVKITEVIQAEIEEVTEEDCMQYVYNLVISRTYEGYLTEIRTIYGILQKSLGVEIKPAPDEWDRLYNVDFYIQIGRKYIGLQIKPVTYEQTPEIYRWKEWLREHTRSLKKILEEKCLLCSRSKKITKKRFIIQKLLKR